MEITIHADSTNTKTIPSLLEEMGYALPCNCRGRHHCNGKPYSFDCSLIPRDTITVSLPETNSYRLSGISLEDMVPVSGPGDTLLVDLGTTTVAAALINRLSGDLRQTAVFPNPQRHYGADVVSRMQASFQDHGDALRECISQAIRENAELLCQKNHQDSRQISLCLIAGNTTMIHLLMGYDCMPLAKSPFIPGESPPAPFRHGNCQVHILPWLSAFVGGDVLAGMYACHMEENSLLIDLGTNGEMLLNHNGHFYATATAAGPAFEGNGLSCGCPGIPGAISKVRLKPLRPALTTIDNKLPVGLCGSGAISLCAELLHHGYITKDGVLTDRFPAKGIFLGYSASRTLMYFTPDDLRNVQLSVAAVAAGIDTLTHEAGITPEGVSSVYLGGGFGFYLDLEACGRLNMFSSLPASHIHPMGNTCLQGLYRCACENILDHASPPSHMDILPRIRTINLADHPYFQQMFLSHMTYSD